MTIQGFLRREYFNTAANPPTDGNGLVYVDTETGLLEITGGALVNTAPASPNWGDLVVRSSAALSRQEATILLSAFTHTTKNEEIFGWYDDTTINTSPSIGIKTESGNGFIAALEDGDATLGFGYNASQEYRLAIVWLADRFLAYVKYDGYYRLMWLQMETATSQVAADSIYNAVGSRDYFQVEVLDATNFTPAQSVSTPSTSTNSTNLGSAAGDDVHYFGQITRPTSGTIVFEFHKYDTNNRNYLEIDSSGNLRLYRVRRGSTSERASSTISNGDYLRLHTEDDRIIVYRNRDKVIDNKIDDNRRNQLWGFTDFGTGGACSVYYQYPLELKTRTDGSNLVTNGTFDSDTTGWSGSGNSWEAGRLKVDDAEAQQNITGLTDGAIYQLTYDYEVISGTHEIFIFQINFNESNITGSGTLNVYIAADEDESMRLDLKANGGGVVYFDNVSLKLVGFAENALQTTLDNRAELELTYDPDDIVTLPYEVRIVSA